jgi:hypothetical protein
VSVLASLTAGELPTSDRSTLTRRTPLILVCRHENSFALGPPCGVDMAK